MNRYITSAPALLTLAAIVILVAGCTRSTSPGPIPKPQAAVQDVSVVPTPTLTVRMPTVAPATATPVVLPTLPPVLPTVPPATPRPTPTPPAVRPTTPASVPGAQTSYTVKPGDRLFSIGRQFGVNPYSIAQANGIGAPYIIHPGQVLVIPAGGTEPQPGTGATLYTVKPGDTVYSIARKFGKSPTAIINANNLANPNRIVPGQVLRIP